ncbi:MAG: ABC transporter permease [Bacteroidota bacterium]
MTPSNIPKWADRFLKWYCRPDLIEEIQGDLYELFDQFEQEAGIAYAQRNFVWNVLSSFRLSTIKKNPIQMNLSPVKSHFKIAYRQLWKQKYHTLINTFGLVLGFACCLLIGLYIQQELSYDTMHPQKDQLYRLLTNDIVDGQDDHWVYHNPPLAGLLVERLPEVENTFRLSTTESRLVKTGAGNQNSYEEKLIFADQSMLELLYFPFRHGDRQNALKEPFSIVLTEAKASQYFGDTNPIGKVLYFDNEMEIPYTISGVIQDTRAKSHLQYDFYISMETVADSKSGSWESSNYITYLKLAAGTNYLAVDKKVLDLASQYKNGVGEGQTTYNLQPVKDIHLKSQTVTIFGHWPTGDPRYLWLFGTIALVILVVAMINFINLSTARAAKRFGEVGIRKIMGSNRGQLINQFLVESVLQSVLALVLSVILIKVSLPLFEKLSGKALALPLTEIGFILICLGLSLLVGILAGLYPAIYIAGFSPLKSIKGYASGSVNGKLQWGLVSGQFITSFVLIFATILIYRQMQYVQKKQLGFDREQVIIVEDSYMLGESMPAFKEQLNQLTDVKSVSLSSYVPVDGYRTNGATIQFNDPEAGVRELEFRRWYIDEDYLSTLGMALTQGRNFSKDFSLDDNSIILNETAAKILGQENTLEQKIRLRNQDYQVVGVVEDFHFNSMRETIRPLAFYRSDLENVSSTIIKANSEDYESLLAQIQTIWGSFAPDQPLRYNFLDERFNQMYAADRRVGITFLTFTILAILIASLGLLALTSFIAENRRKELSIRKVLGASVQSLFRLQTQLFGRLLIIAFLLGMPIAYYFMQQWLTDFAYRINISWDIFLWSMLLTFLLIATTVSYQALRMARTNPVDALRGD